MHFNFVEKSTRTCGIIHIFFTYRADYVTSRSSLAISVMLLRLRARERPTANLCGINMYNYGRVLKPVNCISREILLA